MQVGNFLEFGCRYRKYHVNGLSDFLYPILSNVLEPESLEKAHRFKSSSVCFSL